MSAFHIPVLLQEVLDNLHVRPNGKYIDATLGGGGHALEIVKRGGSVLGIDVDQEAIEHVRTLIQSSKFNPSASLRARVQSLTLVRGNFADIDTIARLHGFENVHGILFDLGVSSHQLEGPFRGFSYLTEGPLDMRMDQRLSVRAADLLQVLHKGELYELFTKLGEERNARTIVDNIIRARGIAPITQTGQLVALLLSAYGITKASSKQKALASKRVFQALRMAVNDELQALKEALPKAISILEHGGRLLVISFHSLEDRIIKNTFKDFAEKGFGKIITKKSVKPNESEQEENARSRSSKLRVFEKQ